MREKGNGCWRGSYATALVLPRITLRSRLSLAQYSFTMVFVMRVKSKHVMLVSEVFLGVGGGGVADALLWEKRRGGASTTTYQENRSRALRESVFLMEQNVSLSALKVGEDDRY